MGGHDVDRVLPLPGAKSRFAVLTFNRVATVDLQQGERGWQARLLTNRVLSYGGWNRISTLTPDGRTFFGTQQALNLLSMELLGTRSVTLEPLQLTSALATPNPDQLVLTGAFRGGGGSSAYLYSIGQRTLAKIDSEQLPSARLLYIPSLRQNAAIVGSKVVMIDRFQAEAPVDALQYIERREGELAALARTRPPAAPHAFANEQQAMAAMIAVGEFPAHVAARMRKEHGITDAMMAAARLEQMRWRAGQGQARPAAAITHAPPPVKGPVADLGRTADIHALGVYQGEGVGKARGASSRTGTVRVHVRRTQRPIILSLSAYEPVRWVLTVEPGAKLAAVLSSGYSQQEILGAGNASDAQHRPRLRLQARRSQLQRPRQRDHPLDRQAHRRIPGALYRGHVRGGEVIKKKGQVHFPCENRGQSALSSLQSIAAQAGRSVANSPPAIRRQVLVGYF